MFRPELTHGIIGAFYDVYNELRFGFLEAVYAGALGIELRERGHLVQGEVPISIRYKGHVVGEYRADLLVDDSVLIEVKATRHLDPNAEHQLLNYLRGSGVEIGLLFHFGPRPYFKRLISTRKNGPFLRDAIPPR
jgi:GxxExxY protein